MSDKKNKNKKQKLIIVLLVLILIISTTALAVLLLRPGEEQPENKPAKGVMGTIKDDWDTDVSQDEASGEQKKGTRIPGYSSAEMKEGDTSLKLRVGNPKENTVGFIATVRLDDGTELYTSPLLKPGQGLEEIPLNKTLSKGKYDAVVYYQCVLLDGKNTPLNAAESAFTLIVN